MMRPIAALAAALAVAALVLAAGAPALSLTRTTRVFLSPGQADFALAEVRFPHSGHVPLSARTLRVAFPAPAGGKYMALASLLHPGRGGGGRALLLVAQRPSSEVVADVLRAESLRSSRALGAPRLITLSDAFARAAHARPRPALCNLSLGGKPLAAQGLRTEAASGSALGVFTAAGAVAAAYDAACGLAYPLAFRQAVQGTPIGCGKGETKSGGLCCPLGAMCVPGPEPVPQPGPEPAPEPVPVEPPHCPPCNPRPGTACPLIAQPSICPAVTPSSPKRFAAAGAG